MVGPQDEFIRRKTFQLKYELIYSYKIRRHTHAHSHIEGLYTIISLLIGEFLPHQFCWYASRVIFTNTDFMEQQREKIPLKQEQDVVGVVLDQSSIFFWSK